MDAVVKSGSGTGFAAVHRVVHVLRNIMNVLKSVILCVRDMVSAVEPQVNEVKRSNRSMFLFSMVGTGRKHWRVLKLGVARSCERVVVV